MSKYYSLVPRPSHHPVFDHLQYVKMKGEGLVHFITSVSIDRGGEGFPIKGMSLKPFLVVSIPSTGVSNIHKVTNVPLLVQDKEHVHKMHSFD